MQNKNLLVLSLIISGMSLTPVIAEYPQTPTKQSQKSQRSLSQGLTTLLFHRGLEKRAAEKKVKAWMNADDEALLEALMARLEAQDIASSEAMMRYFSMAALHDEKIDFKSAETYLSMLYVLDQKHPTAERKAAVTNIVETLV